MNWHYLENGQQRGPVTDEQFSQLVQQGVIQMDTFIWCKGMEKWQRYGELVPESSGGRATGRGGNNRRRRPAHATCRLRRAGGDA